MKKYLALGAALLAVSACNGGGAGNESKSGENGSAEANASGGTGGGSEGAASGAEGSGGSTQTAANGNETISPGLWEMTMQMNMSGPGMPAEAANQMRQPQTRRECITPEETRELADTFGEQPEGMQCSERQFNMRGGRIDGRMTCRGQNREFRIQMAGTYGSTNFDIRQEMSGTMPGAQQPMNMQMRVQGRRVADQCPPEERDGDAATNGAAAEE